MISDGNGRYIFGTVKVGSKGQIVISAEARKIFNIKPGDTLLLLGDEKSGLAIPTRKDDISNLFKVLETANKESGK